VGEAGEAAGHLPPQLQLPPAVVVAAVVEEEVEEVPDLFSRE
jgi:hypothetical protein